MSYTPRVRLGEIRDFPGAVATRTPENPWPGYSDFSVAESDNAVPFPDSTFTVVVTRFLDYKPPKDLEEGNGHFASFGVVHGRRTLGPRATWAEIEAEADRLNHLGARCFGPTNHICFEGGALRDGELHPFFGS